MHEEEERGRFEQRLLVAMAPGPSAPTCDSNCARRSRASVRWSELNPRASRDGLYRR